MLDLFGHISGHSREKPEPGAITMCLNCTAVLVFNLDLTHRIMTPDEYSRLGVDVIMDILRAQRVIANINAKAGNKIGNS
jgi:hypothetical protein